MNQIVLVREVQLLIKDNFTITPLFSSPVLDENTKDLYTAFVLKNAFIEGKNTRGD